jgi:hypothetical protein
MRVGSDYGDREQFTAEIYGTNTADPVFYPDGDLVNYSELYVLGTTGSRAVRQILNHWDNCCFTDDGTRSGMYAPDVRDAVTGIGGGSWSVHIDSTHMIHMLSDAVISAILRHQLGQPFEIQGGPTAPTSIAFSASTVPENSANGTPVGRLSSTDADIGDSHTYSLEDTAGGRFGISGSEVRVANGSLLNFDVAQSHQITVRATDRAGLILDRTFTITVTGVAASAANDSYGTGVGAGPLTVQEPGVLANDTDPNFLPLTAALVSDPTSGSVQLNANGSFTYTPSVGFTGIATFTYRATNAIKPSNIATVSIGVVPSLSIADAQVVEGNSGAHTVSLTVTLSQPSAQAVTLNVTTRDVTTTSTRTADNDFVPLSTPLSFSPGQTTRTVDVQILGDTGDESNETFLVTLGSPTNAVIGRGQATVTIIDDDGSSNSCTPRPDVLTRTRSVAAGALEVTISSSAGLQVVQIRNDGNFTIDVAPGTVIGYPGGVAGLTGHVDLRPIAPSQNLVFVMRRRTPGPMTAALTIQDSCGTWNSVAGAGSAIP